MPPTWGATSLGEDGSFRGRGRPATPHASCACGGSRSEAPRRGHSCGDPGARRQPSWRGEDHGKAATEARGPVWKCGLRLAKCSLRLVRAVPAAPQVPLAPRRAPGSFSGAVRAASGPGHSRGALVGAQGPPLALLPAPRSGAAWGRAGRLQLSAAGASHVWLPRRLLPAPAPLQPLVCL